MVEDSPEHLDLLIGMLDGTYRVQMATAGVPALKLAAAEARPDLILLDIVMPGMDGLEVCRRLKHDKRTRDIPVILLTAQTASESKRKGFELGAADYVTKPYDPAEVMMRVNAQLTLRRARQSLKEQNALLEQRVEERTRELTTANEQLKKAQRAMMERERIIAMGQMASGIAHDINNTLAPITLYTGVLLDSEPGLSERARRFLTTIQQATADIENTTGRLREFYRKREGEETEQRPLDVGVLFGQVIEMTYPRWHTVSQKNGISIEVRSEAADGTPVLPGIESEIREALTNLIFNAVDAMPDGGRITLRCFGRDGGVIIEVEDSGTGMTEDQRVRCMEPFYTTKGTRGTGLGLATVFGAMERHQGKVEIESELNRGTVIRLIFPADDAGMIGAANGGTVE